MRTIEDVLDQFAYHPATPETAPKHAAIRDGFMAFAQHLWDLIPPGPEKTLVFRELQRAQMFANLSVALTAPADLSATRGVARVLPDVDEDQDVDEPAAAVDLEVDGERGTLIGPADKLAEIVRPEAIAEPADVYEPGELAQPGTYGSETLDSVAGEDQGEEEAGADDVERQDEPAHPLFPPVTHFRG